MGKVERIFLYFFILVLSLGWITNPQMDKLIKSNIGALGFFGTGTLLLLNNIYRNDDNETHRSRLI